MIEVKKFLESQSERWERKAVAPLQPRPTEALVLGTHLADTVVVAVVADDAWNFEEVGCKDHMPVKLVVRESLGSTVSMERLRSARALSAHDTYAEWQDRYVNLAQYKKGRDEQDPGARDSASLE